MTVQTLIDLGEHVLALERAAELVAETEGVYISCLGLGAAQIVRVAMRNPEWGLALAQLAEEHSGDDNEPLILATVRVSSVTGR